MKRILFCSLLASAVISAGAEAQQRPAVRPLGAITAKSTDTFSGLVTVRPLSNGSVLVNDVAGRRVLLFDPSLGKSTVVADTTAATANAYASNIGSLVAYRADTTLFVDPQSQSMLVVDPNGKVLKVLAIPRAEDAGTIGNPIGNAAFDAQGRLVYRAFPRFTFRGGAAGSGPGGFALPDPPDSALIVRVDLATRKVDTVGMIRTPKIKLETKTDDKGGISVTSMVNPLPTVDDWVVTSDGRVAFVRGKDYHVDFVGADGARISAAKIPFDWQRMTDEDKVAFIDSVKAARARLGASAPTPVLGGGGAPGGGGGAPQVNIQIGRGGGGGPRPVGAGQGQLNFIPASELPDYKPPFFAGAARADSQGNVWIRTISNVAGGPVYDVVNSKGELIDRVQVPADHSILGFGPNGKVYLLNRATTATTGTLEIATLR